MKSMASPGPAFCPGGMRWDIVAKLKVPLVFAVLAVEVVPVATDCTFAEWPLRCTSVGGAVAPAPAVALEVGFGGMEDVRVVAASCTTHVHHMLHHGRGKLTCPKRRLLTSTTAYH